MFKIAYYYDFYILHGDDYLINNKKTYVLIK